MPDMSPFAQTIFNQKYAHLKPDGTLESWSEVADRVAETVLKAVHAKKSLVRAVARAIETRKFIPGGRYLYATGRPYHQVQNCLLLNVEDSREGWSDLLQKASLALMTGAGIGVDYSAIRGEGKIIRKTGGIATGPIALMKMLNEVGRGVMQGGSRRSAIWAGLNWQHPDVLKFVELKNWQQEVRDLKEKDFNFPAQMDGTNISVQLDDDFFDAIGDENHPQHTHAELVYWATVRQMLKTAEPGFSIDIGKNRKETLRNAPVAPETYVVTENGYMQVGDLAGQLIRVWTGKQWASTTFKKTGEMVPVVKVTMTGGREITCDPSHPFILPGGERVEAQYLLPGSSLKVALPPAMAKMARTRLEDEGYTLGYIYGDGSFSKRYPRAEITLCTKESKQCRASFKEEWLTSVTEDDSRGYMRVYFGNNDIFQGRNKSVFPEDVYGWSESQQASFVAGLFDSDGNYFAPQNRVRLSSVHREFLVGVRRLLEQLGIRAGISTAGISGHGRQQGYTLTVMTEDVNTFASCIPCVRLDIEECQSYRDAKIKVLSVVDAGYSDVYCCDVGVDEHSFMAEGVIISNCTEITSDTDSDICNLGSINLARVESLEEMEELVELGIALLLAGTVYSDVPYPKVDQVRTKNRRLGLGLMGIHEWLLKNGKKYGPDSDLEKYLEIYARSTKVAHRLADEWDLSRPVKTRAIAPNGTIGIVAETTTGIECIFGVAIKRRYLKHLTWNYQYVIDPTAQRLINEGIPPDSIEDAYTLAENVERRVEFQAWVQRFVDHGISSTINLPAWGSPLNNESRVKPFGDMLLKYLPQLRGLTCYPDGARGGQPITPVRYQTAIQHIGNVYQETVDVCDITRGGSCGS